MSPTRFIEINDDVSFSVPVPWELTPYMEELQEWVLENWEVTLENFQTVEDMKQDNWRRFYMKAEELMANGRITGEDLLASIMNEFETNVKERRSLIDDPDDESPLLSWYLLGEELKEWGNYIYDNVSPSNGKDKYEEAVVCLRNAVEIDSDFVAAWIGLGDALYKIASPTYSNSIEREQLLQQASSAYMRTIEIDPEGFGWISLSISLIAEEKYSEAIQVSREALNYHPDNPRILSYIGYSYLELEEFSISEKFLRKSLQFEEDMLETELSWIWNSLGRALSVQRFYTEAQDAFENAIRIDREDAIAWLNLGIVRISQGRLNEGEEALRRAVILQPNLSDTKDEIMRNATSELQEDLDRLIRKQLDSRPESLTSWRCIYCSANLDAEQLELIRANVPIQCESCGTTITRERFLTHKVQPGVENEYTETEPLQGITDEDELKKLAELDGLGLVDDED